MIGGRERPLRQLPWRRYENQLIMWSSPGYLFRFLVQADNRLVSICSQFGGFSHRLVFGVLAWSFMNFVHNTSTVGDHEVLGWVRVK